jgi:hypothetical protein
MSMSMLVSENVSNSLVRIAEMCVNKAVVYCAERYNFNAEEALKELGVVSIELMKKGGKKGVKKSDNKVRSVKASFPLPFNGEMKNECCFALRQNNGLYTQCQVGRNGSSNFCKGCENQMQKTGAETPEYGTIEMRKAVGIFDYIDPKGRKPVAYTKVMKKYKLTEEQVLEEARKLNMVINPEHFVVPDTEGVKRGRPSKEKEPKEKGTRGRPKKSKKVVELDEDTEDLFATLVANANSSEVEEEEEIVIKKNDVSDKKAEKEQKKEAERLAREAKKKAEEEEKAAKKAAAEQAKAEKAAKLAAEKAAKEAEKAAKEAAKKEKEAAKKEKEAKLTPEQVKAQKKAEKELKTTKADEEEMAAMKLEIEQVKAVKAHLKAAKKSSPKPSVEEDEEPDVVKKIEFEGKKYLKSKKTGIIYDYTEYTKNGEQVVVGKWNDASNKIDFNNSEEEEDEEEYDA